MTATRHSSPQPEAEPSGAADTPITATDNRPAAAGARGRDRDRARRITRDTTRPATVAGTLRRALGRAEAATSSADAPGVVDATSSADAPGVADATSAADAPGVADATSSAQPLAPAVAAEHLRARGLTVSPAERRRRRRRQLAWGLGIVAVVGVAGYLFDRSAQPAGPQQVAERIHEAVQREAVAQSGDPTIKVGDLDCVELEPGRGNCLADATSQWRPMEGMMLAVSYEPDPRNGDLSWSLRLP